MKFKNYAKFLVVVTLALGIAVGCSNTTRHDNMAGSNQGVEQVIADAKAALKDAEKGGYAWRDTGKIIKQAEEALAAGDADKANSLAKKALTQSELAKKQAADQDRAVKERFNKS